MESKVQEYPGKECGLSMEEWELEKHIDKIRELPTLRAINYLHKLLHPTPNNQELEDAAKEYAKKIWEDTGVTSESMETLRGAVLVRFSTADFISGANWQSQQFKPQPKKEGE
jgi:hypothetical protein